MNEKETSFIGGEGVEGRIPAKEKAFRFFFTVGFIFDFYLLLYCLFLLSEGWLKD